MNYEFKTKNEYVKFLSNLGEGVVGNESTIYFDDRNGKVIKIFNFNDPNLNLRSKEKKIRELIKLKWKFPTVLLPENIIMCQGTCVGYTMQMLKNYSCIDELQVKAKKKEADLNYMLQVATNLAQLVKELHDEGIIIGDFHQDQFMIKGEKVYICDTDTWGFKDRGADLGADLVGRPEYIDPKARDFEKEGVVVTGYSQENDHFSLAVVIFEMLVGLNPFLGAYPLVKKYDIPLRALNKISIIGNHNIKYPKNFEIKHVAWMSKKLQNSFMQIFERGKRFNILNSLQKQADDLAYCKKHGYYSLRYSKCPVCQTSKDQDTLKKFRTDGVDEVSYDKFYVFTGKEVRKVVDNTTYFDYDENVVHVGRNGILQKEQISSRTESVFFTDNGLKVKIEKMSKIKQFFYTLFGKLNSIYTKKSSFWEKLKKCSDTKDPACTVSVNDAGGKKLFSTIILLTSSGLKLRGNYLFYTERGQELIRVSLTPNGCTSKSVFTTAGLFVFEANNKGEYCICNIIGKKYVDILVNGNKLKQLPVQIPRVINYDAISDKWCIITKDGKNFNTFVVRNNGKVSQQFEHFSFGGLNINHSIFYNSMIVIPADKRLIFLKSGPTVEKSAVIEKEVGIVKDSSIITIQEDKRDGGTYLYVRDTTQVYKIRLN